VRRNKKMMEKRRKDASIVLKRYGFDFTVEPRTTGTPVLV